MKTTEEDDKEEVTVNVLVCKEINVAVQLGNISSLKEGFSRLLTGFGFDFEFS